MAVRKRLAIPATTEETRKLMTSRLLGFFSMADPAPRNPSIPAIANTAPPQQPGENGNGKLKLVKNRIVSRINAVKPKHN